MIIHHILFTSNIDKDYRLSMLYTLFVLLLLKVLWVHSHAYAPIFTYWLYFDKDPSLISFILKHFFYKLDPKDYTILADIYNILCNVGIITIICVVLLRPINNGPYISKWKQFVSKHKVWFTLLYILLILPLCFYHVNYITSGIFIVCNLL